MERGRLTSRNDAETYHLSLWKLKRPRPRQLTPPSKRSRSVVTTIPEPPENMRSMEIPLEDWGDAIVLTGLQLPD